jgi:hypothetical protein
MHLRRALLLFAIVLGLAAVAASISRPTDLEDGPPPRDAAPATPSVGPGPGPGAPVSVELDASEPRAQRIEAGKAASVTVTVAAPGTVEIPTLGLSASAEAQTPARFDVFLREPGRYPVRFVPVAGAESRPAGTLVVLRERAGLAR